MVGKKTQGRRKIPIKKIEKKGNLQVTFSKRRIGLFKKACELGLVCGAQIAILVQSPAGKVYSCGYPSAEALTHPFMTQADAPPPPPPMNPSGHAQISGYQEAVMRLEVEKTRLLMEVDTKNREWWNEPCEGFQLHQLEDYYHALQILGDQVSKKVDGMLPNIPHVQYPTTAASSAFTSSHAPLDSDLFDLVYK